MRLTGAPSFALSRSRFDGSVAGVEGSGESVGDGARSKGRRGIGRMRGGRFSVMVARRNNGWGRFQTDRCFDPCEPSVFQGSIRLPAVGCLQPQKIMTKRFSKKAHSHRLARAPARKLQCLSCQQSRRATGKGRRGLVGGGSPTAVLRTGPRSLHAGAVRCETEVSA